MYKTIKLLNLLNYNIYNFVIHFLHQFLWFWKKIFQYYRYIQNSHIQFGINNN